MVGVSDGLRTPIPISWDEPHQLGRSDSVIVNDRLKARKNVTLHLRQILQISVEVEVNVGTQVDQCF